MIQVVVVFLVAIAVMAVLGRFRRGSTPRLKRGAGKCRACSRPKVGSGPCPCGKSGSG